MPAVDLKGDPVPPIIDLYEAAINTRRPALPHQQAAWNWLEEHVEPRHLEAFAELYRSDPPRKPPLQQHGNPLRVPYMSQTDNGPDGWRHCQTSSIAMCLAYAKLGGIENDLQYLRVVERYGDTTEQAAHQKALASLGVRFRFRQNLGPDDLKAEIKAGRPVAIGVLHRGPVRKPSGGGHWIVVIGFDSDGWIVNDPYGELDLVRGGWVASGGTTGRGLHYSYRNLNPRWCVSGPRDGWGWLIG